MGQFGWPPGAEWLFATQVIIQSGPVAGNELWRFDSANPGFVVDVPITGTVNALDTMAALDFRPSTGELYGLGVYDDIYVGGSSGNHVLRLYRINPLTGAATVVNAAGVTVTATGSYGMSFNSSDEVRIVSSGGLNIRLSPTTGNLIGTDTDLAFVAGDPGLGMSSPVPFVTAIGQDAAGTLWGIDSRTNHDIFVRIGDANGAPTSPNSGEVHTIGSLGVNPAADYNIGLDISPVSGTAYAFASAGSDTLYTVNLGTGAMTSVGAIGSTGALEGFAVAPADFTVPAAAQYPVPALGGIGTVSLLVLLAAMGMWLVRRRMSA
ncbi:MAG: DUF4394 domain-containing protein [Hydrogenophilales bacterium]|nr:DUF4394 domain-containing protein [Hydrogenophilales bacterium]